MSTHIHILGICGTFMGSLAQLAKAKGMRVTGADANVYPPMSTQLEAAGIELIEGFSPEQTALKPDVYVIGNVVTRGNPLMEEILNRGLPYVSGPQWLSQHILHDKWVLAVSGTHGKTTTSSMLAWILEHTGMAPGYLIGGVPGNFAASARLGESDFFVIEADEYDTAFFDKRSKFVHYHPRTLVINNLEYDHADIFPNLAAIQTQFHHVVRIVPKQGMVIHHQSEEVDQVLERGCWSETQEIGGEGVWQYQQHRADGSHFTVVFEGKKSGDIHWPLTGEHNVQNAISAIAAARHVGVLPEHACEALNEFRGVKRRMEPIFESESVTVYDDFAHHPTAIATTLSGLRASVGRDANIIAILEPRSNTMKQGVHKAQLLESIQQASEAIWFQNPKTKWDLSPSVSFEGSPAPGNHLKSSRVIHSTADIITTVVGDLHKKNHPTHIVIMSNGGFENLHQRLTDQL